MRDGFSSAIPPRAGTRLFEHPRRCYLGLFTLWAVDLALIVVSIFTWAPGRSETDLRLNVEYDRGYGEIFQYIKWAGILVGLAFLFSRRRSAVYVALWLLFLYLLLDDSMLIHERVGGTLATWAGVPPLFGLRSIDFGELAISGTSALLLLGLLTWTCLATRDEPAAKLGWQVMLLIAILAFFGVVVDMLHILVSALEMPSITFAAGIIEDGGEMLTASAIAALIVCRALKIGRRAAPSGW